MIYFPHIPKAGGTTLKSIFYQTVGRDKCFKVWSGGYDSNCSPNEFHMVNGKELKKYHAVVGHLPVRNFYSNTYINTLLNREKIHIITSVRDPIERLISLYNYSKLYTKHPNHKLMQGVDPIKFISCQPANQQYDFLKENDEQIITNLISTIDIFLIDDSVPSFSKILYAKTGIKPNNIKTMNITSKISENKELFNINKIPHDLLEKLRQNHSKDYALINAVINSSN